MGTKGSVDILDDTIDLDILNEDLIEVDSKDFVMNTSRVTVSRQHDENGVLISIANDSGVSSAYVYDGKDGKDGDKGEKGDKGDTGNLYELSNSDKDDIADRVRPQMIFEDAPVEILLANNTEYHLTNVGDLTITYPDDPFDCWLSLTTSDGDISISLPASSYIGDPPAFGPSETWELSIRNGTVVAGKAVPDAVYCYYHRNAVGRNL